MELTEAAGLYCPRGSTDGVIALYSSLRMLHFPPHRPTTIQYHPAILVPLRGIARSARGL